MNTRETLILKTLQAKALQSGADNGFIDVLLSQNLEQADQTLTEFDAWPKKDD